MGINSFIKTSDGITVYVNGKPYTADHSHTNYSKIIDAVKAGDYNLVPDLMNLAKAVKIYVDQTPTAGIDIDVEGGTVTYQGQTVHNSMVSRILDMMADGFDITPMKNLLVNLYNNPSNRAVNELYTFLEYGKMPITEDGCFLAYKRVNDDYTSCYDNATKNNIGLVVEMPRNQVDDRSEVTCSHGLHICSFEYLRHYSGDRVIVVKVNPADVVSIPTDYNNTKARVCRYEVINELTREEAGLSSHSFNTSVYITDHEPTREEVEAFVKGEVIDTLKDTLLEVAAQKDASTQVSKWFMLGYHNGYVTGKNKDTIPPDVTAHDEDAKGMSQTELDDVNAGFKIGYKDGRGHKSRQYKKPV